MHTIGAGRQGLLAVHKPSEVLRIPQSCREVGPKKHGDFRRSVVQSARKIRQSARKNATGVSYYNDEQGHGHDGPQGVYLTSMNWCLLIEPLS